MGRDPRQRLTPAHGLANTSWGRNQVTGAAITDALIIMAVGMTVARTLGLAARANDLRRGVPAAGLAA